MNKKNEEKSIKSDKDKQYILTTNMNNDNNLNGSNQQERCNNIKECNLEVDSSISDASNIFENNNFSEIIRIIERNIESCRDDINHIRDDIKHINSKGYFKEIKKTVHSIDGKIENLFDKEENKILYEQLNKIVIDSYSKIENLERMTMKLMNSIEVIEGRLKMLDNKPQNSILSPSNLEEDVLMNLGEYGEKIIKQLTLASRHYAINKDRIDKARETEEKHQEELKLRKEEYKKQGKLDIVESICEKYADLDRIFELETIEGRIIQRILMDAGIEVVEEYSNGRTIAITKENRVDLEGKVSFSHDSLGEYRIVKSAYELNGIIKQKAEVEKIEE